MKYGPALKFPHQRLWSRSVLIFGVMIVVWYHHKNNEEYTFTKQNEVLLSRSQNLECSEEIIAEMKNFPGCMPKTCGRVVTDKLITNSEAEVLLKIAQNAFELSNSHGAVSILDLHTGAISKGSAFVNFFHFEQAPRILTSADFAIFKVVKTKIQHAIAHHFKISADKIFLTQPMFFSEMTNLDPKNELHDVYWASHVDKVAYESFHYTSLLYLNDYGIDFEGGKFIFIDKFHNSTIEPRKGRISIFTSGSENFHAVQRVTSGKRYALTVPFTCNERFATEDPSFKNMSPKNSKQKH